MLEILLGLIGGVAIGWPLGLWLSNKLSDRFWQRYEDACEAEAAEKWAAAQRPVRLVRDSERVLRENLWDLYK